MAKGMKIARGNSSQIDSAVSPITFTYPVSTTATTTVFRGGTGGIASQDTQSLVILVNYKTAAGVAKSDGQIIKQKGSVQFNVQSAAGGVATLTRCALVGGASQPTLAASQMYIKCVSPTGALFFASRITDRHVWNGTAKYPFVMATTSAVNYVDSTSTTGVVLTNAVGGIADDIYAVVEGF
jgi:hypothetical protein